MKNFNYTIIIPHKNIPSLLQRCIDSIPQRDDLQVVIVDDNSSSEVVEFKEFPGLTRVNTEVYFTKEGRGAGYARNVGLKHAKGKYLLFADSDDFFTEDLNDILDSHLTSDSDLTYYCLTSVVSETLEPADRGLKVNDYIKKAKDGDVISADCVRYKFLYPSSKIILRKVVEDNNILFDEVSASNDTMFGVKVACNASHISFSEKVLYCLTLRQNSLVTSYTFKNLESRLKVSIKLFYFLKDRGKFQFAQNSFDHWLQIRHCSKLLWLKSFPLLLKLPFKEIIREIVHRRDYEI